MAYQKIYGFIFARGGSKGVSRKNIRPLAGKPMIAYAIESAKESTYIQRIIVSTEDEQIAQVAKHYGAEVPFMRPMELAEDASSERDAWRHAIEQVGTFDVFVSIPVPCPLRSPKDIDACIEKLLKSPDADIVFTVTRSHSNPYTTMVSLAENGLAQRILCGTNASNRQQAPSVFDVVGVAYATRPQAVMTQNPIWDGKLRTVEVPQERALDIDTEFDFLVADLLLKNGRT